MATWITTFLKMAWEKMMSSERLNYHLSRASVPANWSAYRIHQHVWKGFDEENKTVQPFVFRRLQSSPGAAPNKAHVLIQSAQAPHSAALGLGPNDVQVIAVPGVDRRLFFGMRVQAIVRSRDEGRIRQRAIRDPEQRQQWIENHLARAGLRLEDSWNRQDDVDEPIHDHRLITQATWAEGHVVVVDEAALATALIKGVGRGRSLGFGLLSLARP
jgi:CRISPR-associated protein Cas6/Cse3/CasE subtype I-E